LSCEIFIALFFAGRVIGNSGESTVESGEAKKIDNTSQVKDKSVVNSEIKNSASGDGSGGNGGVESVVCSERAWLFVYYTNKGHDGLFYAWSDDGLLWRQIRGGKPFLQPEVGGESKSRLMRAPSICRSSDGVYHMVWTVAWESRSLGYASSRDMINWSKQRLIPVMEHEKGVRNVWDPELFYDVLGKRFYIIWASTVQDRFKETAGSSEDNFNHRLYYTTTVNFVEFAKTELYWNPNHNVMDPLLVEDKSADLPQRYLLFYKDETLKPKPKKNLLLAVGNSPLGPFVVQKVVSHTDWVQGPSVLRIDGDWYLYYDCYGKRHFGAVRSNDLTNWTNITEKLCFPTNARQGTIIEIDKKTLKKLQEMN
jgi:beta-xylosidase